MAGSPTVEDVVGTVIHGTLQPEDLLQAFIDKLAVLDPERASDIRAKYKAVFDGCREGWNEGEYRTAGSVLHLLMDALSENAPEGLFFGSHPGDGSDFGFWPVESVETATGCTDHHEPNLQNIPIRSEMGAEVRRSLFSGTPCTADYSSVEMRLAESLSTRDEEEGE